MSRFLNQVMAAIRRVDYGQRLVQDDIAIIRPLLQKLEDEISKSDKIRFVQVGTGFVIDTTPFPKRLGFRYIRELLRDPGELISCGELNPAAVSTSQQQILQQKDIRQLRDQADALREFVGSDHGTISPEDILDATERLEFIDKYLDESTRMGRSKSFVSESQKVRQSVNKAINLALDKLEGKAETRHIGEHLRQNIKLGYRCAYFGRWKWKTC